MDTCLMCDLGPGNPHSWSLGGSTRCEGSHSDVALIRIVTSCYRPPVMMLVFIALPCTGRNSSKVFDKFWVFYAKFAAMWDMCRCQRSSVLCTLQVLHTQVPHARWFDVDPECTVGGLPLVLSHRFFLSLLRHNELMFSNGYTLNSRN